MSIAITLGIVLGIAFLAQAGLSMMQMKHFTKEFVALKRRGKVAVGRKPGGFFAGAIVMFLIDDDGIIQESKYMEGITPFAKVKNLAGFEGKNVANLTENDGPDKHRNLKKAIADAAQNYKTFEKGETIPDPPSPFKKLGNILAKKTVNK